MERSHVDTHLFSSCSPASPLERQQKQVNKGTCQSHARYVDGKEQAERIILGGSGEDRERQGTQNRWIPRCWESSVRSQWRAWRPPSLQTEWNSPPGSSGSLGPCPTHAPSVSPGNSPNRGSWDLRQATSFPLASAAPLRKGSTSNNHFPAEEPRPDGALLIRSLLNTVKTQGLPTDSQSKL